MTPFQIGDRVEATEAFYSLGMFALATRPVRGVMTGFSEAPRRRHHLLVLVDGTGVPESYHPIFWMRIGEGM